VLRLYTHAFSIVPWRVRIALHEKGLDYECVVTNLHSKKPEPDFLELNPFAQIPVLDDDGFIVAESMAILEYLEEKHPEPALMPVELESRATVRKWMCWGTDYWPPAWKKWMAPRLAGKSDASTQEAADEGRRAICHHLDVLQRQLVGRHWLVNDYSLADVCYAPFVLVLEHVELGDEIARRSAVAAWVDRLSQRRAVIETVLVPPSP
jgi:glutathione S-transferase